MKSAKRMASREVAMENTLGVRGNLIIPFYFKFIMFSFQNLRQLEQLLETTSKEYVMSDSLRSHL